MNDNDEIQPLAQKGFWGNPLSELPQIDEDEPEGQPEELGEWIDPYFGDSSSEDEAKDVRPWSQKLRELVPHRSQHQETEPYQSDEPADVDGLIDDGEEVEDSWEEEWEEDADPMASWEPASDSDVPEDQDTTEDDVNVESEDLDSTGDLPHIPHDGGNVVSQEVVDSWAARLTWDDEDDVFVRGQRAAYDQEPDSSPAEASAGSPFFSNLANDTAGTESTGSQAVIGAQDAQQASAYESSVEQVGSGASGEQHATSLYGGDENGYIDASMGYEDGATPEAETPESVYDSATPKSLTVVGTRLRIAAVVVCVCIALGVVYALGLRRFSNRMLPNAHIDGLDVSGLTQEEALAALNEQTENYACEIKVADFSLSVKGSDMSLEREEERMAQQAMDAQKPAMWPLALIRGTNLLIDQGISFDEVKLANTVRNAVDEFNDDTLPTDEAGIELNKASDTYELTGNTQGYAVDKEVMAQAALDSMHNLDYVCAPEQQEATHDAKVDDIPLYHYTVEWANRARSSDVPILVNGKEVITSPASQNNEWVWIDEKGPSVEVDSDAVRTWAEYSVAEAAYHVDDWNIYTLNTDEFVDQFCARLSKGVVEGMEVPCFEERTREGQSRDDAYEHSKWDSKRGRYIDVDLTSQFARLWDENGEVLWESAFVSGDMAQGHTTIMGDFEIYLMQEDATLVGLDYDGNGEPDYETPVNYWMPFSGGFGLHDATWRDSFGGDLYVYDGSHGCVNLPYEKAAELYKLTHVGEKVYVHE